MVAIIEIIVPEKTSMEIFADGKKAAFEKTLREHCRGAGMCASCL